MQLSFIYTQFCTLFRVSREVCGRPSLLGPQVMAAFAVNAVLMVG